MELTLQSGRVIQNVTEADLPTLVKDQEFAILATAELTFIQAAKNDDGSTYILEYQDGSLAKHYQATDETITLDRVLTAMAKCLRGDETWRTDFDWTKIEF